MIRHSVRDALALLVMLKDGPRDQVYYDTKDEAWQSAREALAAHPHLTDDGATDTPPADSTGVGAPAAAESATTTAAPSSPHPAAVWDEGYERGKRDHCDFYPSSGECDTEASNPYRTGEGATPAIDRGALLQVVAEYIDDLDNVPAMGSPADHLERRAAHVTDAVMALLRGEPQ